MATEIDRQATVIPAREDPIRVVPLHGIDDLTAPIGVSAPAVAPKLTYRGGPLLTAVEVFTIFWGSGWQHLTFCGYHDSINGQVFYAAMPYPGCNGCLGGLSDIDALTSTSSHELCEAITDAVPGTGWYDDHNGEIGDICAWKTKQVAGHTVQLEWSNQANNCV